MAWYWWILIALVIGWVLTRIELKMIFGEWKWLLVLCFIFIAGCSHPVTVYKILPF